MNYKPIILIHGEPKSIFFEILFKSLKKKFKKPLILIASKKLLQKESKKFKYNLKINSINSDYNDKDLIKNRINLININLDNLRDLKKNNFYIKKSFNLAIKILNNKKTSGLINGPISKKKFLKNRYLGITEYLSNKTNSKKVAMLIYNKTLSVCPITTHLSLKSVKKNIDKKKITSQIKLINNFYLQRFNKKPKIAVTGLNPHCESSSKLNEENLIIKPAIKSLKNKINVKGPFAADTIFLKNNRKKFDVIVGMYHDQVLTPLKTIFEFDAINITLGLPFVRISPDHGPNEIMFGKNLSDATSLIKALKFLDK